MKKTLLFTALCCAFLSGCTKEKDQELPDISSLRLAVVDAKVIYKQSASSAISATGKSTRADDQTGYWKVDFNGDTKRIDFVDANNNRTAAQISSIKKLNDKLLYVEILEPFYKNILVATTTGKIYLSPEQFYGQPLQEDNAGMLYFLLREQEQVYRLDPISFTIGSYLPTGQSVQSFLISGKGSCFYSEDRDLRYGPIKCRSGAIVLGFSNCIRDADKNLYEVVGMVNGPTQIIPLDESAPNAIARNQAETKYCLLGHVYGNIVNPKTHKTILFCEGGIVDMDKDGITIRCVYNTYNDQVDNEKGWTSKLYLHKKLSRNFV